MLNVRDIICLWAKYNTIWGILRDILKGQDFFEHQTLLSVAADNLVVKKVDNTSHPEKLGRTNTKYIVFILDSPCFGYTTAQ